jgi:hypothetical protein
MKATGGFQSVNKAAAAVGVLLLLLVLNLAFGNPLYNLFFGKGVSAGTRPAAPPRVAPGNNNIAKASSKGPSQSSARTAPMKDEFARYDPSLNLDEMKALLSRPVPKLERNPFQLEAPPQEVKKVEEQAPAPPPPPPPPPPILLKAVGLLEKPGGSPEAYICESDASGKCRDDVEVYVVHEGEQFGKHYKAVKIVPTQIDVVDEATQQSAQLLVPQ